MRSVLAAVMICISVLPSVAAAGPGIVGLGRLGASDFTGADAISADGQWAVGYSFTTSPPHWTPVRWSISASPTIEALALPGGVTQGRATGVSADGSAALAMQPTPPSFTSFRWNAPGTASVLNNPIGWSESRGNSISPDGSTVVGHANIGGLGVHAVQWIGDAPGHALTVPAGYSTTAGHTLDGTGRIYGSGLDSLGSRRLLRWNGAAVEELSALPGPPGALAGPFHASASGDVVGGSTRFDPGSGFLLDQAWVWSESDGFTTIAPLPGYASSWITGISADGSIVVGGNRTADLGAGVGFVWTRDGGAVPLAQFLTDAGIDVSGWTLGIAGGISADGTRIVGVGTSLSGGSQGFVAIIPAPGAAALLSGGLLVAMLRRRRSR